MLYNYLEIKKKKNVSKDLYSKISNLPAKAFEERGVGELINRLYTDPDRVMDLLKSLIKLICKATVVLFVLGLCFYISWIHTRIFKRRIKQLYKLIFSIH